MVLFDLSIQKLPVLQKFLQRICKNQNVIGIAEIEKLPLCLAKPMTKGFLGK